MTRPISIVHLEDSAGAGHRLRDALQAEALAPTVLPVKDEPALFAALNANEIDIVVCWPAAAGPGTDLVRRLRVAAPGVPVIALTHADDPQGELEILRAGAAECLGTGRIGRLGWALRRALFDRDESLRRDRIQQELTSLEAQLHHAQRLTDIARLAGGVAHDFNNLLTVINGCCQFLLRSLPEGHELRPLIEPIQQAGERGAELTSRLLAFSRPEASATTLLNLNDVITEVQPMLAPLLGETVRLSVNLDPSLWTVEADAGEISQVLVNLVSNARDAMPEGGTVTIRTGNVDLLTSGVNAGASSFVELVVRDSGHGMTEEVRARIFDPFFTTKPPGQGTGLGLSTVHRIITQHGGEIDVETARDRGTTMRIRLPRATRGEFVRQAEADRLDEVPVPPGTETVLVVEDEPGVRAVVCGFLRGAGYRVLEAADAHGAAALCHTDPGPIDLLISDVVLPGTSGPRMAAQLQAIRPPFQTLFISGYPADTLADTGVDGRNFLSKPFSREVLLQKVRRILAARTPSEATQE